LGANIQNLFELSKFYNLKVEIIVIRTKPPIIFSLILLVLLIIPKEMLTFVPDGEPQKRLVACHQVFIECNS
jgi:hypothetical protein